MSASLSIFEKEHAAREKYIYFVCGLAGALVAYIGKDYYPVRPLDFTGKLTISAMASLSLCLAFGMVHIQFFIKGTSINKDVLVFEEELKNFVNTLVARKAGQCNYSVNTKTGKEYTAEEIEAKIKELTISRDKDFNRMKKWFGWATFWFCICHFFLLLGFSLLIYSKFAA